VSRCRSPTQRQFPPCLLGRFSPGGMQLRAFVSLLLVSRLVVRAPCSRSSAVSANPDSAHRPDAPSHRLAPPLSARVCFLHPVRDSPGLAQRRTSYDVSLCSSCRLTLRSAELRFSPGPSPRLFLFFPCLCPPAGPWFLFFTAGSFFPRPAPPGSARHLWTCFSMGSSFFLSVMS